MILPSLFLLALAGHQKPAVPAYNRQIGKYRIELRVPDEGLYAGETVDVEFRLSDTTQSDPIEGERGIPNANPTASVTMPSMPGMPIVRPHIHSEGVPGDYGIELYFPHGGQYGVAITATPPKEKPIHAAFVLEVRDAEARKHAPIPKPFAVELLNFPKHPRAGQAVPLNLAIKDTKTGERVTSFDVSHTKLLHLIVVSKDLGWFAHEHPTANPDGTFFIDQRFPAGGDYLLFADVAPKDKGAQVISTPVHVAGPTGKWTKHLTPTKPVAQSGGIVARLRPLEWPIPIGKSTTLSFRLRDEKTDKPVTDLEPYLGAFGHLMIIHQDGQAFVHSHPAEDAESTNRVRSGEVRFTARFPKPGIYKAWVQFQRHGKVVTLPYVFQVK